MEHENGEGSEFYHSLAVPARVGIEATGSLQWFSRARPLGDPISYWRCRQDPGDGGAASNDDYSSVTFSAEAARQEKSLTSNIPATFRPMLRSFRLEIKHN
jgi:hypothetical protein